MNSAWVCAGCEDRMPAAVAPRAGANGPVCEGCWDEETAEADLWYEAEGCEAEGCEAEGCEAEGCEADLIGSDWYHEDLP